MRTGSLIDLFKSCTSLLRHSFFPKKISSRPISVLLFAALSFFGAVSGSNAFELTLNHGYNGGIIYNLTWESVDPSTTDATVDYYIFQEFGLDGIDGTGTLANAEAFTEDTSINLGGQGPGSRCFVILSSDSAGGPGFFSDVECHNFQHNLTGEGIVRMDGDGTQLGVDQLWTFTYSLDADAYVTGRIYPPGTQFNTNANGFVTTAGSEPVKTLVDFTPRSFELETHNITMEETWDSRNSSGAIVGNGIYYFLIQATLDSGYFAGGPPNESNAVAIPESYLRAGRVWSIPVNILRILDLAATAITPSNPLSDISYTITGDANVRVLIAQPGSGFTVDSNGDIQALNLNTGLIDNSLVVSTFTFQRNAGANHESWDGISSSGTVMPSGVYPLGISARDDYGNAAVGITGDDFPIFTVVTVERTQGSQGGGGGGDTTPPTLSSINPNDGSVSNNPVTSIVAVLADSESVLNLAGSDIQVRNPSNGIVPGVLTNNGSNTLTFTPNSSLQASGVYTVEVTAVNVAGLSATYDTSFGVDIRLDSDALESSLVLFPNPAKATTATIQYTLATAATVDIDIFNILGERVYSVSVSDAQGLANHSWDLKNNSGKKVGSGLYLVRIKASGTSGEAEAIKKLVVVQ